MAKVYRTPGVYIEEKNAFPSSVVAVPTAIPAFVGYTQLAELDQESLVNVPTRIGSFAEFVSLFGGAPPTKFDISDPNAPAPGGATDGGGDDGGGDDGGGGDDDGGSAAAPAPAPLADEVKFQLDYVDETRFFLYASVRMFYDNGGGDCYVVSIGTYKDAIANGKNPGEFDGEEPVDGELKLIGLKTLIKEYEPTMVVIPDAVLLSESDCFSLQQQMIMHCGYEMKSRVAILDVYDGFKDRSPAGKDVITSFREGVGNNNLDFAAAYYPWLHTTITAEADLNFTYINNLDGLKTLLSSQVDIDVRKDLLKSEKGDEIKAVINKIAADGQTILKAEAEASREKITEEVNADDNIAEGAKADEIDRRVAEKVAAVDTMDSSFHSGAITSLHNTLKAVSPLYKAILGKATEKLNLLPPSGAMAGIYSFVDNEVGVHKAPANVSLNSVTKPAVNLTSKNQEDLNLPLSGKAVNAIRPFIGKGNLVWGARTLDGNSQDWRYISVRRAVIMIEQSVKIAAEAYVFEPNDANTWSSISSMISNFLTNQWKSGVLVGATPEQAFSVEIGLGVTMTPVDILDGFMKITVKIAVSRPAEFIVITFQQKMQES